MSKGFLGLKLRITSKYWSHIEYFLDFIGFRTHSHAPIYINFGLSMWLLQVDLMEGLDKVMQFYGFGQHVQVGRVVVHQQLMQFRFIMFERSLFLMFLCPALMLYICTHLLDLSLTIRSNYISYHGQSILLNRGLIWGVVLGVRHFLDI